MTSAHLSGENFWGGPTYVRDQGYVQLANNGRMLHRSWDDVRCDADTALLLERLEWLTQAGETWISEHRRIRVTEVQQEHGYWSLDLSFDLQNVRGAPLTFGSPDGRRPAGRRLRWAVLARPPLVPARQNPCRRWLERSGGDGPVFPLAGLRRSPRRQRASIHDRPAGPIE